MTEPVEALAKVLYDALAEIGYWPTTADAMQKRGDLDKMAAAALAWIKENGEVGERLNPPDCKSGVHQGRAGSNPALTTTSPVGMGAGGSPTHEIREVCSYNEGMKGRYFMCCHRLADHEGEHVVKGLQVRTPDWGTR